MGLIMAAVAVPGLTEAFAPYLVGVELEPLGVGDHLRARSRFWAHGGIASGVIGASSREPASVPPPEEGLVADDDAVARAARPGSG